MSAVSQKESQKPKLAKTQGKAPTPICNVLAWPAEDKHNAYTGRLYDEVKKAGVRVENYSKSRLLNAEFDLLHLHWPERPLDDDFWPGSVAKTLHFLSRLHYLRMRGRKIVWTMHNLQAHDCAHPRLEQWFWPRFLRSVHGIISLTETGLRSFREKWPAFASIPSFVIPHGHYRGCYRNDVDKIQARLTLQLKPTARVIAFVGQIRPYKNLPALIEAFSKLSDNDLSLVIAGKPRSESEAQSLAVLCKKDNRIKTALGYIPDDQLQIYLKAADLIVLPYREILNSGAAILALSFDRPVLVPAQGALSELAALVGPNWVKTYSGDLDEATLRAALDESGKTAQGAAPLDELDWSTVASKTVQAYQTVLEQNA